MLKLYSLLGVIVAISAAPPHVTADELIGTVIRGEFSDVKDLLTPIPIPHVRTLRQFTFTLLGKNDVRETWAYIENGGAGPQHDHPQIGTLGVGTTGPVGETINWRVLSAKSIQRIRVGKQFVMIMTFFIGGNKACHVEVKYLLQEGYTFIETGQFSGGAETKTLPKIERASCKIS